MQMTQQKAASEAARALVRRRWDKASPEQRLAVGAALTDARRRARAEREYAEHEEAE